MKYPRKVETRLRKFFRGLELTILIAPAIWFVSMRLLVFYWAHLPAVPIVAATPPSPNAYDDFIAAAQLRIDNDDVGYAATSKPSDQRQYSLAERETMVRENAPAITRLKLGLTRNFVNPTLKGSRQDMEFGGLCRSLARVSLLDAQVKTRHGEYAAALDSRLDAVELGEKISNGDIENLKTGGTCQAIGMHEVTDDIPQLSSDQARTEARRLERILAQSPSDQTVLMEERRRTLRELHQELRQDCAQNHSSPMFTRAYENSALTGYSKYMSTVLRHSTEPYTPGAADPPVPKWPTYMIADISAPRWDEQRFSVYLVRTQNALILTELALQAYREDHGHYPENLDALVPDYLSTVPADPFAGHAPLRYRLQGGGYLLYSVGPDTKDDGGVPVVTKTLAGYPTKPELWRRVFQDSLGDIVAGVNK